MVLIELYNWYTRYNNGSGVILWTGLLLSLVSVALLLFTGWKGWEMVYRHRVGVSDEGADLASDRGSVAPPVRRL